MMILLALMFSASMVFMMLNHPLSMGMILLMQTTLISLVTGLMSNHFWFSYIMFLIMIGGMLILFIYMTSIASNEKFNFSPKIMSIIIIICTSMMMIYLIKDPYNYYYMNTINPSNYTNEMMLNKYLNFPSNLVFTSMMIYLLMTMIAVVKITKINYGPLRTSY
uniref:NADH-ubiquinone oxidoreductase chain 6 n=1 Tax=Omalisus fontisbellaquei TaxID=350094 RepID=A0A0S2MNP3_9COLE|nr:NADH deshydrogenase subunit 6 [Omalisus fontisbellaquei]